MGLMDRIKQFWQNRKLKQLPEGQFENYYQYYEDNNNNNWLLQSGNYGQATKLDNDIERFLDCYYDRLQQCDLTQPLDNYRKAYTALVGMNGEQVTEEEYYNNKFKENELLNQIVNDNKYTFQINDQFYHIKSQGYEMPNYQDMVRIYVNCSNGKIEELSQAILDYNNNPNFYMKIPSNDSNAQNPRGEKVVIYCRKNEIDYTIDLLKYSKQQRPDLFQNSEKTLPFIENVDNIASIAYQPITDMYIGLNNQTKKIPQSVNSFITSMLEESYMESAREIARADINLNFLLNNDKYYDETAYMLNYPYIKNNYKDYLIGSMKAKMEVLSRKNNIYIDGINYEQQYQKENNTQSQNRGEDYESR